MTNILNDRERHERYCTGPRHEVQEWGQVGNVRQCEHGKLMLAYEVLGTVPPYWRTLSRFWTPIWYWRASRALRGNDASKQP